VVRVVVQRARDASVRVDGTVVGSFAGPGLVVLVGVTHTDTPTEAAALASRVYGLRVFDHAHLREAGGDIPVDAGREVSARDGGLPILAISQFTLYGSTRKGRRPTWEAAAPGPIAQPLFEAFVDALRAEGAPVSTGRFGADMQVHFTNDGPVTLIMDSAD
jgi:D-tyrosyl-tRNA(Tyr) deacylase